MAEKNNKKESKDPAYNYIKPTFKGSDPAYKYIKSESKDNDPAFKYINNVGWNNFNFDDLSSKEKISSKRLNELFKNKQSLLSYFSSFIDEQVIRRVLEVYLNY